MGQYSYSKDYHLIGPIYFKYGKPGHVVFECGQQTTLQSCST